MQILPKLGQTENMVHPWQTSFAVMRGVDAGRLLTRSPAVLPHLIDAAVITRGIRTRARMVEKNKRMDDLMVAFMQGVYYQTIGFFQWYILCGTFHV
jgi:hypothetical protein